MLPKDLRAGHSGPCVENSLLAAVLVQDVMFSTYVLSPIFPARSISNHYLSDHELENVTADHRIEKGANGNSQSLWM